MRRVIVILPVEKANRQHQLLAAVPVQVRDRGRAQQMRVDEHVRRSGRVARLGARRATDVVLVLPAGPATFPEPREKTPRDETCPRATPPRPGCRNDRHPVARHRAEYPQHRVPRLRHLLGLDLGLGHVLVLTPRAIRPGPKLAIGFSFVASALAVDHLAGAGVANHLIVIVLVLKVVENGEGLRGFFREGVTAGVRAGGVLQESPSTRSSADDASRMGSRFDWAVRHGVTSLCLEAGVGVRRRVLLRNIRHTESAAKVLGVFLVVADVGMGVVDVVGVETRVPCRPARRGGTRSSWRAGRRNRRRVPRRRTRARRMCAPAPRAWTSGLAWAVDLWKAGHSPPLRRPRPRAPRGSARRKAR